MIKSMKYLKTFNQLNESDIPAAGKDGYYEERGKLKDADGFYKVDGKIYKDDEDGNAVYEHPIFGQSWSKDSDERYTMYPQSDKPISEREPIVIAVSGKIISEIYDAYDGYVIVSKPSDKEWISPKVQEYLGKEN